MFQMFHRKHLKGGLNPPESYFKKRKVHMAWYDILTEAELAELEALLDGDGGYEIETIAIEDDEDAWAFADMD